MDITKKISIHYVIDPEDTDERHLYLGMADIHTHGLDKAGSLELQMVLPYLEESAAYIMNTLAEKIWKKEIVPSDGLLVNGIFEDCPVRLNKRLDAFNVPVWRVVIPDGQNRMPEDSDEYPYNEQMHSPYIDSNEETKGDNA